MHTEDRAADRVMRTAEIQHRDGDVSWGWVGSRDRTPRIHMKTVGPGPRTTVYLEEESGGTRTFEVYGDTGIHVPALRDWLASGTNRRDIETAWVTSLAVLGLIETDERGDVILHKGTPAQVRIRACLCTAPAQIVHDDDEWQLEVRRPLSELIWRDDAIFL